MNVVNRVIYGLWAAKMFVNFSKSRQLNFMYWNTFFRERVLRFHQTLNGVHGTKKVKNPCTKVFRGFLKSLQQNSGIEARLGYAVVLRGFRQIPQPNSWIVPILGHATIFSGFLQTLQPNSGTEPRLSYPTVFSGFLQTLQPNSWIVPIFGHATIFSGSPQTFQLSSET